ncbi:ribonuclease HI [uncultured Thiothrix sp.]|uniref:ribonuclease HI n=1 Tax=uncultured Thiothrix sp. TaxID=223185 RepID=UPI0026147CA4|nr:ribonuclease HI [uncultured Thiothrix sp.]HMT94742.1 ribonuclease HI [Thiolinea sp.]
MKKVELYTDGACRGNPGPGGWGVLLRYAEQERELYGYQATATNNQMELMAAIRGLEALKQPCEVTLTTDSKYVLQGMTEWLAGWKRKGWKSASGQPVKNQDLWQRLDIAAQPHKITWSWVRGHTGHPDNERVDGLANRAIDERKSV